MRLGGPVFVSFLEDPEAWVQAHLQAGYRAVYVPFGSEVSDDTVARFRELCRQHDLVIAEVGAWSNPISPDEVVRKAALERCCRGLELADRVGARCCVNIAGSRGEQWDGPHPDNLRPETFDLIVETVRNILDTVQPTRTYYTLETMPWALPDSADSYLQLLRAIDRPRFAVHLDPVNLVNSPARYFDTGALIRECFQKLGPHMQGCHAKDIVLAGRLTVHLDEARPGAGTLDYPVLLREMARLDADMPLMLEHLSKPEEYALAAAHIRTVAAEEGLSL